MFRIIILLSIGITVLSAIFINIYVDLNNELSEQKRIKVDSMENFHEFKNIQAKDIKAIYSGATGSFSTVDRQRKNINLTDQIISTLIEGINESILIESDVELSSYDFRGRSSIVIEINNRKFILSRSFTTNDKNISSLQKNEIVISGWSSEYREDYRLESPKLYDLFAESSKELKE